MSTRYKCSPNLLIIRPQCHFKVLYPVFGFTLTTSPSLRAGSSYVFLVIILLLALPSYQFPHEASLRHQPLVVESLFTQTSSIVLDCYLLPLLVYFSNLIWLSTNNYHLASQLFSLLILHVHLTGYDMDLMDCVQFPILCKLFKFSAINLSSRVSNNSIRYSILAEISLAALNHTYSCLIVWQCLVPRSWNRSLHNQVISVKSSHYIQCYSASRFAGNRMTNQWFFAVVLHVIIACSTIANKIFYFRVHCWCQYISLALHKHVFARRWCACILVKISGCNTSAMMTQFPLKITPLLIVNSSLYDHYSLIHGDISSLVSGHPAKIVTFRACS